jgi:hypothetical protein
MFNDKNYGRRDVVNPAKIESHKENNLLFKQFWNENLAKKGF